MAPASLKRKLMGHPPSGKKRRSRKRRIVKSKHASTSSRAASSPSATTSASSRSRDVNPSAAASLPSSQQQHHQQSPMLSPKIEYSPNAMAKCTTCHKKIAKQQERFGIPSFEARYNKEIYRYYHFKCCPASLSQLVPNPQQQLKQQKLESSWRKHIVQQRTQLLQELQNLRQVFSIRLQVAPFLVLSDTVLESIVYAMPMNDKELLQVHGIGPAKLQNFGDVILCLVRQHRILSRLHQDADAVVKNERKPAAATRQQRQRNRAVGSSPTTSVVAIGVHGDDDNDTSSIDVGEDMVVGKTLTCEELVHQKFEHAAKNGYVISVDDEL